MNSIDLENLAQDMAAMVCELRKNAPHARHGREARKYLQQRFTGMIDIAIDTGVAYGFYSGSRLVAFYLRYKTDEFVPGTQYLFVGHLPGHKVGIKSVENMIHGDKKYFHKHTFLQLQPFSAELVPFALKTGFSMSGIVLTGARAQAERGLAKISPPLKLSSIGLRKKRISSRREINQAIHIQRREFTRNPQFGWFIGTPAFNSMIRKSMIKEISEPKHPTLTWVIVDEADKVQGFYSMFTRPKDPLWGSSAGLGIILHENIQGRGVVKAIYTHLLQVMKQRKIKHFMGGTAQPAVIGLAKVMGREIFTRELRWGKGHFKPEHFGT